MNTPDEIWFPPMERVPVWYYSDPGVARLVGKPVRIVKLYRSVDHEKHFGVLGIARLPSTLGVSPVFYPLIVWSAGNPIGPFAPQQLAVLNPFPESSKSASLFDSFYR